MKHNIADILDKCIEALRQGKTADDCLAAYPGAASDLSPLLRAAAFVRAAPKVQPGESAMRASKAIFLNEAARLRSQQQQHQTKPWQRLALIASHTFALPRPRVLAWTPALSIILAFALVLGTATTAVAATRSLPDEPLYAIKLATEQVQVALTTDPIARADLTLTLAEKRLDEITTLSNLGRPVAAPSIERLTSESKEALSSISRIDDDAMVPRLQRFIGIVSQQQAILPKIQSLPSLDDAVSAALTIAAENEKLATTAIANPSVLKEQPKQSTQPAVAAATDTPAALPTVGQVQPHTPTPAPTDTPVPPQPTATNTPLPSPTRTLTRVPPTPTVVATVATSPTPLPRTHFSGVIERVATSEWVVAGRTVHIDAQTKIENAEAARAGARADVTAVLQSDQTYLAISIKVYPVAEQPAVVTVRGIILSLSASSWTIGGQTVAVNASTTIAGTPAVGLIAEATATRSSTGDLTATVITVKGAPPETTVNGRIERMTIDTWVIGGQSLAIVQGLTTINGSPAIGNQASAVALRQDGGPLIAKSITIQAPIVEQEFEGFINRIDGNVFIINGRRVVRGPATQVDESQGQAQVGQRARVRGVLQGDGSILASSIRILAAAGTGHPASPTVAPPTATPPTATRTPAAPPTVPVSPTASASPTMPASPPATPTTTPSPAASATATQQPVSPTATACPPTITPMPTRQR